MAVKVFKNSIFYIYIKIRVRFASQLRTSTVLEEKSFNSFLVIVYISFLRLCRSFVLKGQRNGTKRVNVQEYLLQQFLYHVSKFQRLYSTKIS